MTPEELDEMANKIGNGLLTRDQNRSMVAEIRCLWAERDARQVVGGPVSEEMLARAKRWRHDTSRDQEAAFPPTLGIVDLIDHIAFLERILADADDFPQARRTGYADGWRAGLEAMADQVQVRGTEQWNAMYGRRLAEDIRKLAEEGPP